jgi:mRNA interferase RelE/StbE
MMIKLSQKAVEFYQSLPDKNRRIVKEHLQRLENYPDIRGDVEQLETPEGKVYYRMHIGRSYTAFYHVREKEGLVCVNVITTIEQAHKRYRNYTGI